MIGGSGGLFSLDGWLAAAAARRPGITEDRTRRAMLGGAVAVGVFVLLGVGALARGSAKSSSDDEASGGSGAGADIVPAADVAVGTAKPVKDPKTGNNAYVLQLTEGQFTALSAVCPHEQCTVGFVSAKDGFLCPCHGSRFAADGKLLEGPATRALSSIPVTVTDGTVRRA